MGEQERGQPPLAHLCAVAEGKHTAVFRRGRADAVEDTGRRCISLVTHGRILDLEVICGEDRGPLLEWLKAAQPTERAMG